MPDLTCPICGVLFHIPPSNISFQRTCSQKCRSIRSRKGTTRKCPICGKDFYVRPNLDKFYVSPCGMVRIPAKYCSRLCSSKARKKERQFSGNGYILVRRPSHPLADGDGLIYEHRVIAEEKLGRPLIKGEVIHHLDGNTINNDPENLAVFPNNTERLKFHRALLKIWEKV